ncbi:MAG: hypothetical protein WAW00_00380 [Candidatus Moraniibacteriota bacterium]
MNVSEKFGDSGIEPGKEAPHNTQESLGIYSPEALMQFGEKIRTQVRIEAIGAKRNTEAALNDVCATAAAKLPEQAVYILRREFDVDGKIHRSFQRVDELAADTEQEISVAATVH